ncbi:hypothetical protein CLOM_g4488, partial [Closterium sp. NIES-68]
LGVTTVAYLGFQVGEGGLSVQQAKVEVVDRLKAPTDCSTLRAQLGFLSYYRRFIPNFSKTAKPLSQLLRKDEGWKWWKEQERAWTTLKEAVKTAPLLKLPNPDEPFLLYTDWSSSGMCTVLCQEEKGTERVVAYVSRSCSPAESNYSSQSKAKLERTKAELQSLPIGSIGYRWSLDMVGEMPLSRRGKQYIP